MHQDSRMAFAMRVAALHLWGAALLPEQWKRYLILNCEDILDF
jgi:hypothetical protein